MQLEKVTKEAATLKKENEALKGEVNVARVEAAVSRQRSSTVSLCILSCLG